MSKLGKAAWLIIILFFFNNRSYAQQSDSTSLHVVITYEIQYNRNPHKHQISRYFWMVSLDDMKDNRSAPSPFYDSDFSVEQFQNCQKGDSSYMFVQLSGERYDFGDEDQEMKSNLVEMIYQNRREVQTIVKKWPSGLKQRTKIYLTPLMGNFCRCPMRYSSGRLIKYQGAFFMPVGNFSVYPEFWNSEWVDSWVLRDLTLSNPQNVAYSRG